MDFSSPIFLFLFLPLVLLLHGLAPRPARNSILLAASLFFYAWGETLYILVMLLSIACNYAAGRAIARQPEGGMARRVSLGAAIALNLSLLLGFKYSHFLVENYSWLIEQMGFPAVELQPVHLPLGISFFTFQALSYLIDVYRGTIRAERSPLTLGLYICLFPQLIAGPIVRYPQIAGALRERSVSVDAFAEGARRFTQGLAKKMLIANTLAVPVDTIFALPADGLGASLAWFGITCYALQIYFDFSGYSDMAIGLGRMLGFPFPENFNYPYVARSLSEFWRRWHISLSTWFRDYLYIPLGGNRGSTLRTYRNLVAVFLLCGLWHGASWNFAVWGLFHGCFLVFERCAGRALLERLPRPLCHVYTLGVVLIAWVFFRAETLPQALAFLGAMLGMGAGGEGQYLLEFASVAVVLALFAGVLGATPWWRHLASGARDQTPLYRLLRSARLGPMLGPLVTAALFVASAMHLATQTFNPFIYFRF